MYFLLKMEIFQAAMWSFTRGKPTGCVNDHLVGGLFTNSWMKNSVQVVKLVSISPGSRGEKVFFKCRDHPSSHFCFFKNQGFHYTWVLDPLATASSHWFTQPPPRQQKVFCRTVKSKSPVKIGLLWMNPYEPRKKKKLPTFHWCSGCLTGILIMVYYNPLI